MKSQIVILVLSVLSACDPMDSSLAITNRGLDSTYFFYGEGDDLRLRYEKVLKEQGIRIGYSNVINVLGPGSTRKLGMLGSEGTWRYYINHCADSKMRLYVINRDTIAKYSFEELMNKPTSYRTYRFSIDSLDAIKWNIELRD